MQTAPYVETKIDGRIGRVILNRAEQYNALNREMVRQIAEAFESFDAHDDIRVILIEGTGKAFSSGADIEELAGETPISLELADPFADWDRISRIKKPIIGAVHGFVLGGGFELALSCDLLIAAEGTQFGFPEILIGVMPGAGGTQRLTKRIGRTRALNWLLTGERMQANQALDYGLVNEVVALAELEKAAIALAEKIAAQPPLSVRLIKEAVDKAVDLSTQAGMEHERKNFYLLFSTEDQKEGMSAFKEKRRPEFKGR
ncbi:enoyl-CoA hydratase/isomerase family protein [Exiguobacterium flavidum]|uniref:enoyl-CoA hydratase/isomerase family protein n=1 Tax=Exiguobacterium flavidum TaxID=2184695 RepID=UPI000DF72EDB|nr:enoyl-CoA hydratase-related protein [Exiguobacterium flavidum]